MHATKSFNPVRHGLQMRFMFARWGYGQTVACVLCILGLISWGGWLPRLHAQDQAQKRLLMQAQKSLEFSVRPIPLPQQSQNEINLARFLTTLGQNHYAEQQIKTLFAVANKTGITLQHAEYKSAFDQQGRFQTYQIRLPVTGTYSAIHTFCERTLAAIPFASLDEISFKRDSVANRTLEAKLRFTLYLSHPDDTVPKTTP